MEQSFFPYLVYGVRVQALNIYCVICEMPDIMVDAFVKFSCKFQD